MSYIDDETKLRIQQEYLSKQAQEALDTLKTIHVTQILETLNATSWQGKGQILETLDKEHGKASIDLVYAFPDVELVTEHTDNLTKPQYKERTSTHIVSVEATPQNSSTLIGVYHKQDIIISHLNDSILDHVIGATTLAETSIAKVFDYGTQAASAATLLRSTLGGFNSSEFTYLQQVSSRDSIPSPISDEIAAKERIIRFATQINARK